MDKNPFNKIASEFGASLGVFSAIISAIIFAISFATERLFPGEFYGIPISTIIFIGTITSILTLLLVISRISLKSLRSESSDASSETARLVQNRKISFNDFPKLLNKLGIDQVIIEDKEIPSKRLLETIEASNFDDDGESGAWEPEIPYALENANGIGLDSALVQKLVSIHPIYNLGLDRLVRSKDAAERRGLTNLWIGIGMAILGLTILGIRALLITSITTSDIFIQFIPSIALGILLELLAFFFLRLYSKSLEESKYYANEITILEARFLGYFMATVHGDEAERKAIITDFGKYLRELPTLRSTPVLDKATTGALIDLVKSVATATKGGANE